MIRVEGLSKDFGPRRAIDQLNFHADQGEILTPLTDPASIATATPGALPVETPSSTP